MSKQKIVLVIFRLWLCDDIVDENKTTLFRRFNIIQTKSHPRSSR